MGKKKLISCLAILCFILASCSGSKTPGSSFIESKDSGPQGISSEDSRQNDDEHSYSSGQVFSSRLPSTTTNSSSSSGSGSSSPHSSYTSSNPPVSIPDSSLHKNYGNDIFSISSCLFNPNQSNRDIYNFVDKLSRNRISAMNDTSFTSNAGIPGFSNLIKASQADGYIVYQLNDIYDFKIGIVAPVVKNGDIKVYLSDDSKNYYKVTETITKTGSVTGIYNKYEIKNKFLLGKPARFLKIAFENHKDIYISEVMANEFCAYVNINSDKLLNSISSNAVISSGAYRIKDSNKATITYYRDNLKSMRIKVKYKGAAPNVTIGASADGNTFKDYTCYSTAPADDNGFKVAYYYPDTTFFNGAYFPRIQIQKSDNTGNSLYITEVSFCEISFNDNMSNTELMYGYSKGLKSITASNKKYMQATGDGSITYNVNDVTGIVFDIRFVGSEPNMTLMASKDDKTYKTIPFSLIDTRVKSGYTYGTVVNKNAIPADTNFIKLNFSSTVFIGEIQIEGINDTVEQLNKILSRQSKHFSDLFSISHIANGYQHTNKDIIREGVDNVLDMNGKIIDLYLSKTSYKKDYKFNTDWGSAGQVNTVTDLAKTKFFKYAFDNPNIHTYILYLDTGYQPNWKNSTGDLERDFNATYDLAKYFYTQYNGTSKTFIFRTWEADWWLIDSYPPKPNVEQTYSDRAFQNFTTWINNRQSAVEKARKDFAGSSNVNVYNALMFVNGDIAMEGKRCVLNNVVPNTKCDLYAFSAYSTAIDEHSFNESLKFIKDKCPDNALFGNNNVFIGEMGIPEQNLGVSRSYHNLIKTFKIAANNNMRYINYWQMYCNEPKQSGDPHDNKNYNGYWIIRADGTKPPIYHLFKQALKSK